eukprot:jgi/Chlat1/1059/Chrsp110S08633
MSSAEAAMSQLLTALLEFHTQRIHRLNTAGPDASQKIWWPFTQHQQVPTSKVTVIDSRHGDNFSVLQNTHLDDGSKSTELAPLYDACASWWTQGVGANLQTDMARAVAYATGRYGHVMFPENVHEPALELTELLLEGPGRGWAHRVFFSDNGSTAIEVALKMAFRKYSTDHGVREMETELLVLALSGSYHGDTLGAMDAQAPSPYNGFKQHPWYQGRGVFIDPPTVHCKDAVWRLQLPEQMRAAASAAGTVEDDLHWTRCEEVFVGSCGRDCDICSHHGEQHSHQGSTRDSSQLKCMYEKCIAAVLDEQTKSQPHIGALILEPVLHGAGGMELIDPLFQRVLMRECRRRRIPIILDEVFAGMWRLGRQSAAALLGCRPDIACYAKLLTGGVVPLSVTLATEDVFNAFQGDSKLDALLHGHSYTAHAIGCQAAVTALKLYVDPRKNPNYNPASGTLRELWDTSLAHNISSLSNVQRVTYLGTVFAVELCSEARGYASSSATVIIKRLRRKAIYARPLGNVVYIMCAPTTPPSRCTQLLEVLLGELSSEHAS